MIDERAAQNLPQPPAMSLAALRRLIRRESAIQRRRGYVLEVLGRMLEEHKALAFILTTALLEALLRTASPWIAARAIDEALPNSASSMLASLAVRIVVAVGFSSWAGWLHQQASVVLQERLVASTQTDLMQRYLNTAFTDLQTTEFGATKVTFSGAASFIAAMAQAVVEVMTQVATAAATLFMLGTYNTALATVVCAASLVTGGGAALLAAREIRFASKHMTASSQAQQLLYLLLRAVPTLRAHHATERMVGRWLDRCHAQAHQAVAMETTRLARAALLLATQQAISLTSTAWLVHEALDGTVSIGAMISCTILVNQVLHATLSVTQSVLSVFVLRPAIKRVELLRKRSEQTALARAPSPKCALQSGTVQVCGVWYRYNPNESWVLHDYSSTYEAGSYTVLRAASGAGKSTLLRLIAGLITPEHGRVLVCGRDPAATSGLVAYVPQQTLLLDSSIATNLSVLSGGKLGQALVAAELTGLAHLLAQLPMGIETLISGSGNNLSAGQRQLVTLTAAFASEHPILLLDEVVSQLDAQVRERIQWAALVKDRTVIAVQHG